MWSRHPSGINAGWTELIPGTPGVYLRVAAMGKRSPLLPFSGNCVLKCFACLVSGGEAMLAFRDPPGTWVNAFIDLLIIHGDNYLWALFFCLYV